MWKERPPKCTYVFILVSIITYLLQRRTRIWIYLAFTPAFAAYYPWTIVTSIFLHLGFDHMLFNMLALFLFGSILEGRTGSKLFVTLFLVSGIVGNLGYYITAANPQIPVLGASGSIYGVIGTLAILEPLRVVYFYGMLPLPMIAAACLWALADFFGLFIPSRVAHGVHLVGMLVGVLVGLYLRSLNND